MNTPTSGSERRLYPRRILRCTADVRASPAETFRARTLDISPGGMAIITEHNPRVGQKLALRLPLPVRPKGMVAIEVLSEVLHSFLALNEGGFKVGLRFVGVEAAAASAINQFLK